MKLTGIQGSWHRCEHAGFCNGCQRADNEPIAVLVLQTMAFRLCPECAEAMQSLLENMLEDVPHETV